jgi:ribonuclease Z
VVYQKNGVTVMAFEVDHGAKIKPAYGYRIDYRGHAVVISGDTRFDENLIRHAAGVDLLIHEVATARPELLQDPFVQAVLAHHTSPREAGTVFRRTRPKLAAYTHIIQRSRPGIPPVTLDEIIEQTRETYDGPLEMAKTSCRSRSAIR